MSDLLDLLAALDPQAVLTHVLMPCMTYACGESMLDIGGRFQVGIQDWSGIDCPDCRAHGEAELRAEMSRQQGQQAAAS